MALYVAYYLSPALARLVIPQTCTWHDPLFSGGRAPTRPTPKLKPHPLKVVDSTAVCDGTASSKAKVCPRQKSPIRNWYTCALVLLLEGILFRNRNTCTLERTLFVYTVQCAAVIITKEMPHDSNQFWNNYKGRIRIVRYWKRILKSSNNWFFSWTPAAGWSVKIQCVYCLFSPKLKAANNLLKRSSLVFCKFSKYFTCF